MNNINILATKTQAPNLDIGLTAPTRLGKLDCYQTDLGEYEFWVGDFFIGQYYGNYTDKLKEFHSLCRGIENGFVPQGFQVLLYPELEGQTVLSPAGQPCLVKDGKVITPLGPFPITAYSQAVIDIWHEQLAEKEKPIASIEAGDYIAHQFADGRVEYEEKKNKFCQYDYRRKQ